ncbi:Ubiquitin--protein ligase [Bertholletia excelsa]
MKIYLAPTDSLSISFYFLLVILPSSRNSNSIRFSQLSSYFFISEGCDTNAEKKTLAKMADFAHLERMGRELKCPICLSLLNSAVSLTCNHVFCTSCIEKSMKSASSCPVCKVPYRRREVRPAPHMDNLVNIYRSMEIASGFDIFVTQNKAKLSDKEDKSESDMIYRRQETGGKCIEGNKSKQLLNLKQEDSNLDLLKPSFPTKKRIQVPQYLPPENQAQAEPVGGGSTEPSKLKPESSSFALKEKPVANEKREQVFAPFFWLRDEDAEKLSQLSHGGPDMDTPPNVPCFSDIKDSDDETSCEVAAKGEANTTVDDAYYFDSEMFEWTQRPCSPELCSSPMREAADTDEFIGVQTRELQSSSHYATTTAKQEVESRKNLTPRQMIGNDKNCSTGLSSLRTDNSNTGDGIKKTHKRRRKLTGQTKKKQTGKAVGVILEFQGDSDSVHGSNIYENSDKNGNLLNSNKRSQKRGKKVTFDCGAEKCLPEGTQALSIQANQPELDNKITVPECPASFAQKESSKKGMANQQRGKPKRSKIKPTNNSKCDREVRLSKKQKIFNDDRSKDNKLVSGCNDAFAKDTQPSGKSQFCSEVSDLQDPTKMKKALPALDGVVLKNCEIVQNKIQCAFCHSTEESEASGVMVHYFNGKPVAADFDGGSKVIHVHRNCTEWAPNVYFEDDNAINLEAELSRSRRIKCCCCDIKGAALGCYEKSCRKSFHVPCAKLIAQCRWDNDNFVMLCPLHASSKLPNEVSQSQIGMKKQNIPKRPSENHQQEITVKHTNKACQQWDSCGSFEKFVLCCSTLVSEEKEIISEFEKLSGVKILKNWHPSVTHVIASTDENGACRRTLKFLMGILEGKWILNIKWIKACMKAMEPVDEQPYEIGVDIHGVRDGPRLGRLRILNKQRKLFDGCNFYFTGDFVHSYKGYLQDLVITAGGNVLQRRPISRDQQSLTCGNPSSTFIIYSLELPNNCSPNKRNLIVNQRRLDAEALASSSGAIVASNLWVLGSIAACKWQNLTEI